jgi:acetylornithine deacetylase/succinyl-diaminopimelate desuccinylase-like protein
MTTGPTVEARPAAELLQELLRLDTSNPPGREAEGIAYVDRLLHSAGIETKLIESAPGRPNLVARLRGRGSTSPLLWQGHIDVVPALPQEWTHPPFSGQIADSCIWGRGALDMKGGVAMMLAALLRARANDLTPSGDVILAILADEEAGSDHGASFLVNNHADLFEDVRYAIGEFGGFSLRLAGRRLYPIQVAERQICWLKATVRGPAGHGSLGSKDATAARLAEVLRRLDRARLPIHLTPVVREMLEAIAGTLPAPIAPVVRALAHPRLDHAGLKVLQRFSEQLTLLLRNTATPNVIRAGNLPSVSVMPSTAELYLDGRLLPGFRPDDFIAELHELVGHDVEFEIFRYDGGPDRADFGLYPTLASIIRNHDDKAYPVPMLMPASSDGRFFSRLGIQPYGFLPMKLPTSLNFTRLIHSADERIPVAAVQFGSDCMFELLERFGEAQDPRADKSV